ncbi:MAG: hypothetical protein WC205_16825 [Opitutaceae bacterium]|jgi:hypothetical protein
MTKRDQEIADLRSELAAVREKAELAMALALRADERLHLLLVRKVETGALLPQSPRSRAGGRKSR